MRRSRGASKVDPPGAGRVLDLVRVEVPVGTVTGFGAEAGRQKIETDDDHSYDY